MRGCWEADALCVGQISDLPSAEWQVGNLPHTRTARGADLGPAVRTEAGWKPAPRPPRGAAMTMSSTLRSLLADCKANPDEDAPRLVLADWLDDNGEPERAELVRIQVQWSGLP